MGTGSIDVLKILSEMHHSFNIKAFIMWGWNTSQIPHQCEANYEPSNYLKAVNVLYIYIAHFYLGVSHGLLIQQRFFETSSTGGKKHSYCLWKWECENKKSCCLLPPCPWPQATEDFEVTTGTLLFVELSLAETFHHDVAPSYILQLWRKEMSYWPNTSSPIPPGVSHLAEKFILFKTRDRYSHPGLASSNPRIICDIYNLLWDVAGTMFHSFVL